MTNESRHEQPDRASRLAASGSTGRFRRRGLTRLKSFSLVELMVAIAILSILVLLLLGMLGGLTTVWQQGQAHNERRTVAQAVLDRMTRDISQAVLPMARSNTNSLDFVINPSWITTNNYPQSIYFQAPVATDGGNNGNLAVVGYYVQWINGTATLTRLLINPSSTVYAVYSGTHNAWISNSLLTNAPATFVSSTSPNNYGGLLAENVIGLWVQALDPLGHPTQQSINTTANYGEVFDSRYPYAYTNYDLIGGGGTTGYIVTNAASAFPASVQIAVAVVDSRTAKRITSIPTYPALTGNIWTDVQNFYNHLPTAVQKGTEIQTTTVPLANGPR